MQGLSLSVLDLVPVCEGVGASQSVRRSVELVQLAEACGYVRHWYAEHHSLASVASSSPEVLIAHALAATTRIRVGSGGVMLPNHSPLRIAEAFHTLEALHPGRVDLGIGRAPGTDGNASRALRAMGGEAFSQLMGELLSFSGKRYPQGHWYHRVRVMPDDAVLPPIWILGSSGASAAAAGGAGFGYAFASHFSPEPAAPAVAAYREAFQPSAMFARPHVILGIAVVCAETEAEARAHALTQELAWLRLRRGEYRPLPSCAEAAEYPWTEADHDELARTRGPSVVGTPAMVRARIEAMAAEAGADEVMIAANIHDHAARLRSYQLIAEAFAIRAAA